MTTSWRPRGRWYSSSDRQRSHVNAFSPGLLGAQGIWRAIRGRRTWCDTWPGSFITPLILSLLSLTFSASFGRRESLNNSMACSLLCFQVGWNLSQDYIKIEINPLIPAYYIKSAGRFWLHKWWQIRPVQSCPPAVGPADLSVQLPLPPGVAACNKSVGTVAATCHS